MKKKENKKEQILKKNKEVEKTIKYSFKKPELLARALTHRSFIHEHKEISWHHNERLEFLGDAVLEFLVSDFLFNHFKKHSEGILTTLRAATVRTETLAGVIESLKISPYILMSYGEAASGGRNKRAILADTFEAILGAIYLDGGMPACKKFVKRVIYPIILDIEAREAYIDYKTYVQELVQENEKLTPVYKVLEAKGPDHKKVFKVALIVGSKEVSDGQGTSKKRAEEAAAYKAIKILKKRYAKNKVSKKRQKE